jgi:hypothetical protein
MSTKYMVSSHSLFLSGSDPQTPLGTSCPPSAWNEILRFPVQLSNYLKTMKSYNYIVFVSAMFLYASICFAPMFLYGILVLDAHLTTDVSSRQI